MTQLIIPILILAQNPNPSTWTRPFVPFYSDIFAQERIYSASGIYVGSKEVDEAAFDTIFGLDGTLHEADAYHIHNVSELITGVTTVSYLTDDRGPGWWAVGSDIFSASLTYDTRMLEKIQVNGYSWPLVADADHIAYEMSAVDSSLIAGFTLKRVTEMTALSIKANRVEWFYLSSTFDPDADVANGLWLVQGQPLGAIMNGVDYEKE